VKHDDIENALKSAINQQVESKSPEELEALVEKEERVQEAYQYGVVGLFTVLLAVFAPLVTYFQKKKANEIKSGEQ